MKAVYKLQIDCGRMGELEGVFTAETEQVEWLVKTEKSIYFGEVLGKHSEVFLPMKKEHFKLVSQDENVVKVIEENELENGYNPFNYSFLCTDAEELLGDKYEDDLSALEVYELLH